METQSIQLGTITYTPIKLEAPWMNNPKGSELTLLDRAAQVLISRGVAKPIEVREEKPKQQETKEVQAPKQDKMVRSARTK